MCVIEIDSVIEREGEREMIKRIREKAEREM